MDQANAVAPTSSEGSSFKCQLLFRLIYRCGNNFRFLFYLHLTQNTHFTYSFSYHCRISCRLSLIVISNSRIRLLDVAAFSMHCRNEYIFYSPTRQKDRQKDTVKTKSYTQS